MENLNPLEVLKEELDTDDVAQKINAVHRLRIVGTIMGPEGIRNSLLPFLDTLIKKEEDEVLFAIAEEIGYLAPMLGANQMAVIPYLENLCGQDETVVRDMAVKSIVNMIPNCSDAEINNHIIPMVIKLASNEANFTWRVSAANIMCKIYPRAGPNKEKLRQKFTELSNEETPMVRRVIANKIGEMAPVYEKQNVINDLIPPFKQLSADDQDLVRVLCLDSLKSLAKVLTRDDNKTHTLPVIIQAAEDKSWRVRLALSKNFADIAESFGKEITDLSLVQTFSTLLKDVENDVKIQAVKSLSRFVRIISADKLTILIPLIITLGKDPYPSVRCKKCGYTAQITKVLGNIVGLVPKDLAYQKLLPLIGDMMKDDNQEVRQGAIRAVCKFGEAIGTEVINTISPYLKSASEDPKWRVRSEAIDATASLALAYQNIEVFMKSLEPIFMLYIKDKAAAVREFGTERIPDLLRVFGPNWMSIFVGKLADILNKDSGHAVKITALNSLRTVALSQFGDTIADKIVAIVFKALSDPVPNVRIVGIRTLAAIAKRYESAQLRDQIKKSIATISEDPDKDVKFYCAEALLGL